MHIETDNPGINGVYKTVLGGGATYLLIKENDGVKPLRRREGEREREWVGFFSLCFSLFFWFYFVSANTGKITHK